MSATQEVGEIFGRNGKGHLAHALLRSPTVLIASIGLWGMNVYVFRRFNIDYVKILQYDVRKLHQDEYERHLKTNHHQHQRRKQQSSAATASSSSTSSSVDTEMIPLTRSTSSSGAGVMGEQSAGDRGTEQSDILYDQEMSIMDTSFHTNNNEEYCFDGETVTSGQLICFSLTLWLLLYGTYTVWIGWFNGGVLGALGAFYAGSVLAMYLPLKSTKWLRHSADVVLHRLWELIHPRCHYCTDADKIPRPIPFVDVFFADGMCSLSKVFFDIGMLLHMASYYPKPVAKSAWNILIPSACAAVPYMIRARQCFVMWSFTSLKNDPGRYQHLWNALKYSTSIFPLVLSAYQKTVMTARAEDLESALIVLLIINASYALWWDVGTFFFPPFCCC
jgi:EXS family